MVRFLLFLSSALMLAAATMTLQSCSNENAEAPAPSGPRNGLVTLPDGSTMVAAEGSSTQAIAEWLTAQDGESAEFEFSGFAHDRPVFTSRGLGHAADLATMLRASPAATIELRGDAARTKALAHLLEERGISKDRVTLVPNTGNRGGVAMKLHRGSDAPLLAAKD